MLNLYLTYTFTKKHLAGAQAESGTDAHMHKQR